MSGRGKAVNTKARPAVVIPPDQQVRQANASLRGYAYQIYLTALAWLDLDHEAVLLVETAEDYAVATRSALVGVQVKEDHSKNLTLRSPGVTKCLNGLWALRKANPDPSVSVTYMTTTQIARERRVSFPGEVPGVRYWQMAAAGGHDLAPLRILLSQLSLDADLASWIEDATDEVLRTELLQRFDWRYSVAGLEDRVVQLERKIAGRGLPKSRREVRQAANAVLLHLLMIAARGDQVELTARMLDDVIEAATSVTISQDHLRRIAGEATGYTPPLHLRERDEGGRLFFFGAKDRVPLVGRDGVLSELQAWVATPDAFSWMLVSGPGGSGKSRLAFELCKALIGEAGDWAAGFLSAGSDYTAPSQFLRFDPEKPTLLVIDYAGDDPERAGHLVRILIERATAGAFSEKVRLLLLDRNGPMGPWWSRFLAQHEWLMRPASADNMALAPLGPPALAAILRHVAGPELEIDEAAALAALQALDPQGRPLFAALAGDALRAGDAVGDLSREGLIDDLLEREERHWERAAKSAEAVRPHAMACALATMTGALQLPADAKALGSERLPFSQSRFEPALIAAITGKNEPGQIAALEPDILGEWMVLDILVPRSPFDEDPDHLLELVDRRIAASATAASHYAAFRLRLVQDFAPQMLNSRLMAPPDLAAPDHVLASWLTFVADAFEELNDHFPLEAAALHAEVQTRRQRSTSPEILQAAAFAEASYIRAMPSTRLVEARALLDDLLVWTAEHPQSYRMALPAADVGHALVDALLDDDEIGPAHAVFDKLRLYAYRFRDCDDPFEISERAADAGLALRAWHNYFDHDAEVDRLNAILWEQPVGPGLLDLAAQTALVLTMASEGVDNHLSYQEIKARSRARPEVREAAFWAGQCGAMDLRYTHAGETTIDYVERVMDVIAWVQDHEGWPDMGEIHSWLVEDGLATEELDLGRVPASRLLGAWETQLVEAKTRNVMPAQDNELIWIQQTLEEILQRNPHLHWVRPMRARMARVMSDHFPI